MKCWWGHGISWASVKLQFVCNLFISCDSLDSILKFSLSSAQFLAIDTWKILVNVRKVTSPFMEVHECFLFLLVVDVYRILCWRSRWQNHARFGAPFIGTRNTLHLQTDVWSAAVSSQKHGYSQRLEGRQCSVDSWGMCQTGYVVHCTDIIGQKSN